jgi:tetratricopeptide (TPR) repeat protein
MLRKLFFALNITLLITTSLRASVPDAIVVPPHQPKINRDTLADILQQKDDFLRQKRLVVFIKNYIQASMENKLVAVQDTFNQAFIKYSMVDKDAFSTFMASFALYKQHNLKDAEVYMNKAIQLADKRNDPYLLFQFYTHLGFIQTDRGNFIDAIYNYRLAKKEVLKLKDKLKDNRPQASLNINISDLYYKSGFYTQSLNYLDKALALISNDEKNMTLLSSVIYYNKSENYFRKNNLDSLKAYHAKLNDPRNKNYKIFNYRQRTAYYITLLKRDYPLAIKQIQTLVKNPKYIYNELEDQRLADAYFMNGQLDSAKKKVDEQLAIAAANNHPEIKYHLYELLAQIAQEKGDNKLAADNFMMALKESQENNRRLAQVGDISSQIKIDEAENLYVQRTAVYEKERLWLIFMVVVSALIIVAIALIYRNVKQKRHYEQLLFATKKAELAFINSHEVRKHLTNILGIMDIIQHSDNNKEEYKQCEEYLLSSAKRLDEAIKNISEKINE